MPSFKTGYDGTVTEADQRLYVLRRHDRAIAFALTALDDRFWHLEWRDEALIQIQMSKPEELRERRSKVGRVWVATEERKQGLGGALVVAALSHLAVEPSEVGWEFPFTDAGQRAPER